MTEETIRKNVEAVFGLAAPPEFESFSDAAQPGGELKEAPEAPALPRPFSVFLQADAARASLLAEELGRIADEGGAADGLRQASARAAEVAETEAGLAQHALGLFATHHPLGKRTPIPTLLRRTAFVAASLTPQADVTLKSKSSGAEVALDWFREDPLANEHHEHWHWVYPSVPPDPKPVKERHGELFYYMHQQMLAPYDVERIAVGLRPVQPLTDFAGSLGEGYDPGLLMTSKSYKLREPGEGMVDHQPEYDRATLTELTRRLTQAARERLLGAGAGAVPLQGHEGSNLLGHEAEPTAARRFKDQYGWHHGMGHMLISAASDEGLGVMRDTATAIRDPAFWRWHRHVDDIHFIYQDSLEPHVFADRPPVAISKLAIEPEAGGPVGDAAGIPELGTRMRTGVYKLLNDKGYRYDFLSHEPFRVRIELKNGADTNIPVTLRLYLIPHGLFAPDADPTTDEGRLMRRHAIELDKVKLEAAPGASSHLRAGRDMSVLRRPAVVDPAEVADINPDKDEHATQECTCGWPFGLLLRRGTAQGMAFSLFAMLTDNRIDRIGSPKACGSMSFCGMDDRYPDARPMGYPFDRPLTAPLAVVVSENPNMMLKPITVRWTNPPAVT